MASQCECCPKQALFRCGKCKSARYCSRECERCGLKRRWGEQDALWPVGTLALALAPPLVTPRWELRTQLVPT